MAALIYLTNIYELPCEIARITSRDVNFHLQKEYATSDILNSLSSLSECDMYFQKDYISVYVKKEHVESIKFI